MSQPTPSGPPVAADEPVDVTVVGAGPGGSTTAATLAVDSPDPLPGERTVFVRGRVDDRLITALAKPAPAA
ncbi:hypothetical protein [Ornithinimicrobium cavernae]|uniref:hypothetical protein n=1 Tax=Ornithinimicrobium cavernae TaxID=2666047 RepID=UPI000D692CFA|nr:hypothetical protein [Ornithinimicrobium cavernae]